MGTQTPRSGSEGIQVVCRNRKASQKYEILATIEAGMALRGTEVKSLRRGRASIDEAYARVRRGEVWLLNADIPIYPEAGPLNHEPRRPRKLLLHRREIASLEGHVSRKGHTLIPLKIYFRRGLAKVELAVARGKREYDRREAIRREEAQKAIRKAMLKRRQ